MKRVLLDTSVYGELVLDDQFTEQLGPAVPKSLVICGSDLIRRVLMLSLYDAFVGKERRTFLTTDLVEILAARYFIEYKKLGGRLSKAVVWNDFRIIAAASLHAVDVVISGDTDSMLAQEAVEAYSLVNKEYDFRVPNFMTYQEFKEKFKRLIYEK